jgi:hypothetical protein
MSELYECIELFCMKYHSPTFLKLTYTPYIGRYVKKLQYYPNDEDEWTEEAIDSHLECIAQHCSNLEELRIGGCASSIGVSTMRAMVQNNPQLLILSIDGFKGDIFDLVDILHRSKIVTLLIGDLQENKRHGDPPIIEHVKELDIRGWRWDSEEIQSCIRAFRDVETLSLHKVIESEAVAHISSCDHIRCLSMPFQDATDLVSLLPCLPQLDTIKCRMNQSLWEKLRVSSVKHLEIHLVDKHMIFSPFPTLESVELTWDFYQSKCKDLRSLFQALPGLKKLVAKHGILTDDHAGMIVQHCPQLEVINVQSQSVTNNFLSHIGRLRSVKVLVLDQCRNMNSKGFASLFTSRSLEELHIRNIPVTIQDTKDLLDHVRTIKEIHTTISITELSRQLPNYATLFRN